MVLHKEIADNSFGHSALGQAGIIMGSGDATVTKLLKNSCLLEFTFFFYSDKTRKEYSLMSEVFPV